MLLEAPFLIWVHGVGGRLLPLLELADRGLLWLLGRMHEHAFALLALCGITKNAVSKLREKWESKGDTYWV